MSGEGYKVAVKIAVHADGAACVYHAAIQQRESAGWVERPLTVDEKMPVARALASLLECILR